MTNNKLVRAGQELQLSEGPAPFELITDGDNLEVLATALISQRQQTDAQLSYALHSLLSIGRHVETGSIDFNTYVETTLSFSAQKARSLVQGWTDFQTLGLSPHLLEEISWSKFRALGSAINRGVITADNIAEWLPLITHDGEFALRVSDVNSKVKILLADNAGDTAQVGDMTPLTMKVPTSKMPEFQRNLEVVKEKFGKSTGDEGTVMSRLMEFAAACTVDESVESYKVGGILNLKRNIESMAPGFTVLLVQTAAGAQLPTDAQVLPATSVYHHDGEYVIATDLEDAKRMLDTDEDPQHWPLGVSDSYSATPEVDILSGLPDADSIPLEDQGLFLKGLSEQLTAVDPGTAEAFADVRSSLVEAPEGQFTATYSWMKGHADKIGCVLSA